MKKIYIKLFGELDMFGANPSLRSRTLPYSASPCLGAFSLVIIGFFLWLFISRLVKMSNLDSSELSATKKYQKQFQPQTIPKFYFGVSFADKFFNTSLPDKFNRYDVDSYSKYFQMKAKINNITYNMTPCNIQKWKILGDNYEVEYNSSALDRSYCLPDLLEITATISYPFFEFYFSYCDNSTRNDCIQQDIVNQQIATVKNSLITFPVWLNFLSVYVQAKSKQGLKYEVLSKRVSTAPKDTLLSAITINFQKYQVITNYNVWPFDLPNSQSTDVGFSPTNVFYSFENKQNATNLNLIQVYGIKTEAIEVQERQLTKVDEILSYVGGLFGLIILAFMLCLGKYNEYKYELKVGESSFNYDDDGYKIKSKDLNAFTYIKYSIFSWFYLLGIKLNWKYYQQIHETREQAKYCLDISKFFRRIEFLERVIWKQEDNNVLRTQSLIQQDSIQQIKKKRLLYEYFQRIIELKKAASVEDVLENNKKAFDKQSKIFKTAVKKNNKNIQEGNQNNNNSDDEAKWKEYLDKIQSIESIKQSLMFDLNLYEFEEICDKLSQLNESRMISCNAANQIIQENFLSIEQQLAKNLAELTKDEKKLIIQKIPLKIIHRLRISAKSMNNSNPNETQKRAQLIENYSKNKMKLN